MSGRFALDRALLNTDFPARQWGNLGLWEEDRNYSDACEALAVRLAEHAGLCAGSRVLDVGFGHGDELLLWKRHFGVGPITGIEADPTGLAEARRRTAGFADVTLSSDDQAWEDESYDYVFALDCAYHFAPRQQFFIRARQALREGGVLALTDMAVTTAPGTAGRVRRWLARACDIPPENLLTQEEYARHLAAMGFCEVRIERLDGVLDGFAQFVFRLLRQGLPTWSGGWLRIVVAAMAARWLQRRDAVRYIMVAARKSG